MTIKIYHMGYVQVYGLADHGQLSGEEAAHVMMGFVASKLAEKYTVTGYGAVKFISSVFFLHCAGLAFIQYL